MFGFGVRFSCFLGEAHLLTWFVFCVRVFEQLEIGGFR
jgi:hypothetical protein